MTYQLSLVLALAILTPSCSSTECTEEYRQVWVALRDQGGQPVCEALIKVVSPSKVVDAVVSPTIDPCVFGGQLPSDLRQPQYRLEVSAAGFQPAVVEMRTDLDECDHPQPEVVSGPAEVRPASLPTVTVMLQTL